MSCPVFTEERFARLLDNSIDPASRAALRAHFECPCDECLERLAQREELLPLLAGPEARLSAAEKDAAFAAAAQSLPAHVVPLRRRSVSTRAIGLALAASVAIVVAAVINRGPGYTGLKGAGGPQVELLAFALPAGAPAGASRQVADGEQLGAGERLVFRLRSSRKAELLLLAQPRGGAIVELWNGALPDRGELEVAGAGQALALDPSRVGAAFSLAAVACSKAILPSALSAVQLTEVDLARALPDCWVDLLHLRAKETR